MRSVKIRIIAAACHAPIDNQQATVGMTFECAEISKWIARRVEQRRAQQFTPQRGNHCLVPTGFKCDPRSSRAR